MGCSIHSGVLLQQRAGHTEEASRIRSPRDGQAAAAWHIQDEMVGTQVTRVLRRRSSPRPRMADSYATAWCL